MRMLIPVKEVIKRDGRLEPFDIERIITSITWALEETGEGTRRTAEYLAQKVVEQLPEVASVETIQDKIIETLRSEGYSKTADAFQDYRRRHEELRALRSVAFDTGKMVQDYLELRDWRVRENANIVPSYSSLMFNTAGAIQARWLLDKYYPAPVADAHISGDLHLHDMYMGAVCYSYSGDEVVIARVNGELLLVSLRQLYDMFYDEIEIEKGVCVKDVRNLNVEVLDANGFTKVKFLTKKRKDKKMLFIKTEDGKSCIVTNDHPMITEQGVIPAEHLQIGMKLQSINPLNLLSQLFGKSELYISDELAKLGIFDFKLDGVEGNIVYLTPHLKNEPVRKDALISPGKPVITRIWSTHYNPWWVKNAPRKEKVEHGIQNKLQLDEDLGYLVGLFIAEGSYGTEGRIDIAQKNPDIISKVIRILDKLGWSYSYETKGEIRRISIFSTIVKYLFELVFGIRPYSKNKNVPVQCLNFSEKFIKGLVAGIIDGDGTISPDWGHIQVRVASRTLCNQLHILLSYLGFNVYDEFQGIGSERTYRGRKIVQRYPLYGIYFMPKFSIDIPSLKYHKALDIIRRKKKTAVKIYSNEVKVIAKKEIPIADDFVYDITTESGTFICNGIFSHNCQGWSIEDILLRGIEPIGTNPKSNPPKHLDVLTMQMVNFVGMATQESAGAQAFNAVDVLLAPFVHYDGLDERKLKQIIQMFVYNLNTTSRWGGQSPFTNITLSITVPEDLKNKPAIVGGKPMDRTYGDFEEETQMVAKAFLEVFLEGDAQGRPFTFPIPTFGLTKDFPWDSEVSDLLWRVTAKYGLPYFQNFINSDLRPSDVRAMCCHLHLDLRELRRNVTGGLFGSADKTGSIGVVTINMPRIGYLSKGDEDKFFRLLEQRMKLARRSLLLKRKLIQRNMDAGLLPLTKTYLGTLQNHFNTIGLVGMHEALCNFGFEDGIVGEDGRRFAIKVLEFMRKKVREFQEEDGVLYNLEATPAEGTSYRLARLDRKKFPDIKTSGEKEPYYTGSTLLPASYEINLADAFRHQEPLQTLYTGGTVFHIYLGESPEPRATAQLMKRACENFRIPYYSVTPTYSICPNHGYLTGEHWKCPTCGADCDVYSRVVGYFRPVRNWNAGKQEEFRQRKFFKI